MSEEKVSQFLAMKGSFFGSQNMHVVKSILTGLNDSKFDMLQMAEFKDPNTVFIGSIFGVSKFMLGQAGINILQLMLCVVGIGFIWLLLDLVNAKKNTNEYNMKELQKLAY